MINSSSQEVLQTVPTTTDYLHEKKILDYCVEVHVLNLVQPHKQRRAREMDTNHVKFLEESFLKSPGGDFHLLAGLLLKGSLVQVGNEGGATIEVLGGNHTRAALTSLYRRGLRNPLVRVRLYGNLTDEEALHIGYNHNELATRSKKMSFTDKVEIVRKVMQLYPNNSRKKLADFFGYEKGAPEAKNKLTVHIRLASLPQEVLELVKQCEEAFDQKNPLSQATIRGVMWKPMEEMMAALTELRDKGLKAYKAYLKSLKPVSEPVEEQTTSGSQNITSEDAKIEKLKNQVKELQSKCKALEDKVKILENENKKLRDAQETEDPDDVIAPTPDVSFGVEVNDDDHDEEKENTFMGSLSLAKRLSKRVSDKETSSSPLQAKKRKLMELPILPEREDFQEGELVEALWDDGHWYEAKIIKTLKNGTFKVQYTMDKKKKNVEEKAMRKI